MADRGVRRDDVRGRVHHRAHFLGHGGLMTLVLGVDPGVNGCGVAVMEGKELLSAWYLSRPNWAVKGYAGAAAMGWDLGRALSKHRPGGAAYIERMRVYPGTRANDPNDLLDVAAVGGAVALAVADKWTLNAVYATTWKGNVPKEIMTRRIKALLFSNEDARIDKTCGKALLHNVYDAIGICLWNVGRLSPRVIKRGDE